jgi:Tol biopolymer transport system component
VPEVFAPLKDYQDLDYPDVLPGGQWVLFGAATHEGHWPEADTVAQNVVTGERRVVLRNGHFARYLPTGHLVFARSGTLYAVAFDSRSLQARGREVPVVQNVATTEISGQAPFAVAANGTLIYVSGTPAVTDGSHNQIVRVNRNGEAKPLSTDPRRYSDPRLSPDGSKLAVAVADGEQRAHIWIMDVTTGAATQLSFDGEEDRFPVWTADGREVLFTSRLGKNHAIWRKAADGSGEARHIVDGSKDLAATDVYRHTLVYQDQGKGGGRDLFTLDLNAGGSPQPLLATAADESGARVSPNGAWIAYTSTSGATDNVRVYIRPFPNTAAGGQRAISEASGVTPAWSPAGDEIDYLSITPPEFRMVSVSLAATPTTITATGHRELFAFAPRFSVVTPSETVHAQPFDIMRSGGDFIAVATMERVSSPDGSPTAARTGTDDPNRPRINVVLNWFEELKRLVPVE